MKVLIVTDAWHPQINGVVRTYEHLGEELEKRGHTVRVIGPSDFPMRIPLFVYPEIKLAIAPYRRLKKMVEAYKPDRVHVATEGPLGWAARKLCRRTNRSYTTTYHTHFPDYVAKRVARRGSFIYRAAHELGKNYVRSFHRYSKSMMVATKSLETELKGWNFKTPMRRLTRGAKLDQFHPGPRTLFDGLARPVALYVGRVAVEKSIEDFLAMPWDGTKIIVGEGPSLIELREKYPHARFVGRKTGQELAEHYRSSDVFVFPSRTDTFGMVIVEALACGVPVAGYDVTGPRDIITEPFLGAIHENDLAIAAQQALTCGSIEQRVQHVKQHYTWQAAGDQFETILLQDV